MLLKTSCFHKTVFLKNITRFWPLWAAYLFVLVLIMPVTIMNSLAKYRLLMTDRNIALFRNIYYAAVRYGTVVIGPFSIFIAMAVFSYLYTSKSAGFFHSLPIKRSGLFFSNYLSGIAFMMIPNILIFLVSLLVEILFGKVEIIPLFIWLGVMTAETVFFFSLGSFCAMLTGHIVVLPVIYGIINFSAAVIEYLGRITIQSFVYGMPPNTELLFSRLSPAYYIVTEPLIGSNFIKETKTTVYFMQDWDIFIWIFIAGLLFALFSYLLYKRRHTETAGDVISVPLVRPIFKYYITFCAGLVLGMILNQIFFARDQSVYTAYKILSCFIIASFIGYLSSEMLLKKSFRVLKDSYKGYILFAFILTAFLLSFELDLYGYERRVPAVNEIAEVHVGPHLNRVSGEITDGAVFTRAEEIEQAAALHRVMVGNKGQLESMYFTYYNTGSFGGALTPSVTVIEPAAEAVVKYASTQKVKREIYIRDETVIRFYMVYKLQNGRELLRYYNLPVTTGLLSDPVSAAGRYVSLINSPTAIKGRYLKEDIQQSDMNVCNLTFDDGASNITLEQEKAFYLYEAVKKDLLSGDIGREYLLLNNEYYDSVYDLRIDFTFMPDDKDDTGQYKYNGMQVIPCTDSKNTLEALRALNILGDIRPLTLRESYTSIDK